MSLRLASALSISLVLSVLFGGCSSVDWMPRYMEAKVRIDSRYRSQMTALKFQRMRGQISAGYYERRSRALESQWDRELTVAKARAQGTAGSSHRSSANRSSSSRSRSPTEDSGGRDDSAPSSTGSGGSGGGGEIHVPLDGGGELRGRSSGGGGRLE